MAYNYFNDITFGNPIFFFLLGLLPFLIFWYFKKNSGKQTALAISSLQANGLSSAKSRFVHLPFLLRLLILIFIILALAKPQSKSNEQTTEGEGIDIALCMDVSGSMTATDLAPNRLEAAKNVAIDFVNTRIADRIAVVIFASESFTQCPLTTDKPTVINAIENIHNGMLTNATSIGDGLSTAVDRLRSSKTASKIVILLTDGENNGGIIDPKYAKEIAKTYGIKVYTIGVGTDGTTTQPIQTPLGNVEMRTLKVNIDEKLLTEIATETGGKYFRAKDNIGLQEIYKTIDTLEKSTIEIAKLTKYNDKFLPFTLLATLFLFLEIVLRYVVIRKFP